MQIFGEVGKSLDGSGEVKTTVIDLYNSFNKMHEAWEVYLTCWDRLAAPVEFASALMLEFLESDLVSSWIATASSRYNLLKETQSESVGFRVYIENMNDRAKNDGITQTDDCMKQFVMFSQKMGEVKGTFMRTAVKMMPESEHCAEPAGEAEPWYGPAILREAALVFKGRAFFEVIFDWLSAGKDSVSLEAITRWGERMHHADPALWTFHHPQDGKPTNRFGAFRQEGYTKEEFVQYFQVLCLYHTTTGLKWHHGSDMSGLLKPCKDRGEFGMFCGVQHDGFDWPTAQAVLEAVVEDWVHTTSSSESDFEHKAMDTQNKDWLALSDCASALEEMFDNCFFTQTPSFQWRFDRVQDAFRAQLSSGYFRDCVSRIAKIVNSPAVQKCDQLGVFRKGTGPKGFFGQMIVLFDAPPAYRSGFAAAYRCARFYEHAVKAGNESSGENKKQLVTVSKISSLLYGVLGDNGAEERRIKDAVDIVWWSNAAVEEADLLALDIAETEEKLEKFAKRSKPGDEQEIANLQDALEQKQRPRLEYLSGLLDQDWKIKLVKLIQRSDEPSGKAPVKEDNALQEDAQTVGLEDVVVHESATPSGAGTGLGSTTARQFEEMNVNVYLLDNMLIATSPVKVKFEPDTKSTGVDVATPRDNARLTRSMSSLLDEDTFIQVDVMQTALLSGVASPLLQVDWVCLPQLDECTDATNRPFYSEGTPNAIAVKGIRERDVGRLEETYYFTAPQVSSHILEGLYTALRTQVVDDTTLEEARTPVAALEAPTNVEVEVEAPLPKVLPAKPDEVQQQM
eukprot:TRINITY_DN11226_c0_g1_i2.p1 TRINITY_DN11226_c0_g1~~TRINITY_DN11226_c0_g1_i2.p1  ORF type:complete len:794 (-),score=147.27 TRINITY_DN11226_c0_g1_i2:233-2614(-)